MWAVDHVQVPQLHLDPPTHQLGGESVLRSVIHNNKLKEGVTIQESYIFTVLRYRTLEPIHSLRLSLQVNL